MIHNKWQKWISMVIPFISRKIRKELYIIKNLRTSRKMKMTIKNKFCQKIHHNHRNNKIQKILKPSLLRILNNIVLQINKSNWKILHKIYQIKIMIIMIMSKNNNTNNNYLVVKMIIHN